jgi:hypothetical protein
VGFARVTAACALSAGSATLGHRISPLKLPATTLKTRGALSEIRA